MEARRIVLAGYGAEPADVVAAGLSSDEPALRARALTASQRLGRRSVSARVAALRDDAAIVRRTACELEARTPQPSSRVARALVGCLDDGDALVAVRAADALGELRERSAVSALSAVATGHADARCREAAVAALGAIGEETGLDAVLAAQHDKPPVRRRAVVALAAFDGPRVEAALAAALEDRDWQVRQAAEALRDASGANAS